MAKCEICREKESCLMLFEAENGKRKYACDCCASEVSKKDQLLPDTFSNMLVLWKSFSGFAQ